jgi:predicted nucleotide-binding protein (sugar kinase/HSP70/actin superfamily)
MQHSVKDEDTVDVLNKETVEKMMKEYENVVLYIAENKLSEENITPAEREKLKSMAPVYINVFGQDVCDVFMHDVLQIPYFLDYFDVDIKSALHG